MSRIKNTTAYIFDTEPEITSYLIGTDVGDGKRTKSYRIDTVFGLLPSLGYITEAPINGSPYIRQDGAWEVVPPSGAGSVFSVFGRTGAVTGLVGDYNSFYSLLAHTHTESEITDLQSYLLPSAIGTTVQAWDAALDLVTGTNTGDQTSIVGITGTKAQFNTAASDGTFMYIGDAPTSHTHVEADITDLGTYLESVDIADINATGTPGSGNFLRGDGVWAAGGAVSSFNARAGVVTSVVGDYNSFFSLLGHTHTKSEITDFSVDIADINTTGTASSSTWLRGDGVWGTILGGVSSVFGRTAAVVAVAGDYDAFYYTEAEVDSFLNDKVDLSGDTMTGSLILSSGHIFLNGSAVNNWAFRADTNDTNLSGLWFTSGEDGILILRNSAGTSSTLSPDGSAGFGSTGQITVPNEVYGALWNGSLEVPTKNSVYDKIESIDAAKADLTGDTFSGQVLVPDDAYSAGWNTNDEVPTKSSVYNKIETLPTVTSGGGTTGFVLDGASSGTHTVSSQDYDWYRIGDLVFFKIQLTGIGGTTVGTFQINIGGTTLPAPNLTYSKYVWPVLTSIVPTDYIDVLAICTSSSIISITARTAISNTIHGTISGVAASSDTIELTGTYITS